MTLITNFPVCREADVDPYLGTLVNMDGVRTKSEHIRLLEGRKRFSVNVIRQLMNHKDDESKSKQEVWDEAVQLAIGVLKTDIKQLVVRANKDPCMYSEKKC